MEDRHVANLPLLRIMDVKAVKVEKLLLLLHHHRFIEKIQEEVVPEVIIIIIIIIIKAAVTNPHLPLNREAIATRVVVAVPACKALTHPNGLID